VVFPGKQCCIYFLVWFSQRMPPCCGLDGMAVGKIDKFLLPPMLIPPNQKWNTANTYPSNTFDVLNKEK
jgi:hypothetical protein